MTVTLPFTLTAGQPENVSQLMANLTTLRDALNNDYEPAFSAYKTLESRAQDLATVGAITGLLNRDNSLGTAGSTSASWLNTLYIDPADFTASSRTTKFRLKAQIATNAVPPAITFTFGLYPVTASAGTSGQTPYINTIGTVITGSTVAFASPGATNGFVGASSDFTASAGYYIPVLVNSAPMAAGSRITLNVQLQYRQV